MAKFKAGDNVRIKSWDSMVKEFGVNEDCNIMCRGIFVNAMRCFCGKVVTIKSICKNMYSVEGTGWRFSDDMIEGLAANCNQRIVITTDGKTTLARLYDGKNIVKFAEAKCSPEDEFDFKTGAAIAISRLFDYTIKFVDDDSFDWKAFKAGKIAVKVTENSFVDFVSAAEEYGLRFDNNKHFNPFKDHFLLLLRPALMAAAGKTNVEDNEIYIMYKDNMLKLGFHYYDMEEFVW